MKNISVLKILNIKVIKVAFLTIFISQTPLFEQMKIGTNGRVGIGTNTQHRAFGVTIKRDVVYQDGNNTTLLEIKFYDVGY